MNVLAFETRWAKNKSSDISWSICIQISIKSFTCCAVCVWQRHKTKAAVKYNPTVSKTSKQSYTSDNKTEVLHVCLILDVLVYVLVIQHVEKTFCLDSVKESHFSVILLVTLQNGLLCLRIILHVCKSIISLYRLMRSADCMILYNSSLVCDVCWEAMSFICRFQRKR